MCENDKSKTCVWRWQERFLAEGVDGLVRDKTRPPSTAPLDQTVIDRVVALTNTDPPYGAANGTAGTMASAIGVSVSAVQRIWHAHQLRSKRLRPLKPSKDPAFANKVYDVVEPYVDPPAHAVALSVNENSQIQALDRTQPSLPMKPGRLGSKIHDHKRHGTTTPFAALSVFGGRLIGRDMQRHRHQEFIRLLNAVARAVPTRKIHAVVDNYAAHEHPKVRAWLHRHPRWIFHFTPTLRSWLNAVEGLFAKPSRRRSTCHHEPLRRRDQR
jgi:hypothetical protein